MLKETLLMSSECEGSNSTPCLLLSSKDQDRQDSKLLSPQSSRKFFSRKPQSARNSEVFRTRRNAEQARQFASFYSPTNSHKRDRSKDDTSVKGDKPSSNASHIILATDRTMKQSGQLQIKYQASVIVPVACPRPPRSSAYFTQSEFKQQASSNLTVQQYSRTDEASAKKIRILQIQLQAVTLENSRLKEHINLLRSNNQQLKSRLNGVAPDDNPRFSRKTHQSSLIHDHSQQLLKLKQTCLDLQKSLASSTQDLDHERQKLQDMHSEYQQKQRKLRQSILQLQSIITANKRENSLLKSTNQQLGIRLWNCHRQITELQATHREHKNQTMNFLKKQRIANHAKRMDRFQKYDREEELFELSPEHST